MRFEKGSSPLLAERGAHVKMRGLNNKLKTHCPRGHPYSGDNLKFRKDNGSRVCRACTNARKRSLAYSSWRQMILRCYNEKDNSYRYHGARGISVCQRWRDSYRVFLGDMGQRPAGLTLERINNDGNYEPGNCRWATRAEQNLNTRVVRLISFNNETNSVRGWAKKLKIAPKALRYRLEKWPLAKALTTPSQRT